MGDMLVIAAMAIFGAYGLFFRLLPAISPVLFLFSMQVIGMAVFAAIMPRQKVTGRKIWTLLVMLAFAELVNDLSYFNAFRLTTVANATFTHQLMFVFLLILAPLFLGEKTDRKEWSALIPALLGLVLIFQEGFRISSRDTLGVILGTVSAFAYAVMVVIYRYLAKDGLDIRSVNFWRYVFSATILIPVIATVSNSVSVLLASAPILALFGLAFAGIATAIHTTGMKFTRSLHVAIIGQSEPVFASIYAFLILHEAPTLRTLIGGTLIIGSGLWLAFQKNRAD